MTTESAATEPAATPALRGGSLERTPPADIFRGLYAERGTAQVLLSHRGEERTFWFDRGQLTAAVSNREAQLVGELLRTFGLADESVLFSAFEKALAEPGRGLAKALKETGAVPGFVADACVRALAERILYDTFPWNTGVYSIIPIEKLPELPVRFDRTFGSLVLEGYRRVSADQPVPGRPIEPRSRPVLADELLLRYQTLQITAEEAEVLSRVDGVASAGDVSPDLRILARFEAIGLLEFFAPGKTVPKREEANGLMSLNVEIFGSAPPPRAAEQLERQTGLVWNTWRRIDWATLYEVIGAARDAEPVDTMRAVHERARIFHPDHAVKPSLVDARDALEALFRKILSAERTFGSPDNRAAYDRSLSTGGQSMAIASQGGEVEVQRSIAKANYQRARDLYEQEDYWPALEMVRQSVEYDPEKSEYWVLLSRIQRKNPKWIRRSSETMRRAVDKLVGNVEVLWELSECCLAERNETERVKALKEILKIDPANRRAQGALAEIAAMKPNR